MRWLMIALALLISSPVVAQDEDRATIGWLLRECESENFLNSGFCLGYLQGLRDGATVYITAQYADMGFCIPLGVTLGQAQAVFIKWAKNNPEQWHRRMHLGPISAWIEAFPCKK